MMLAFTVWLYGSGVAILWHYLYRKSLIKALQAVAEIKALPEEVFYRILNQVTFFFVVIWPLTLCMAIEHLWRQNSK